MMKEEYVNLFYPFFRDAHSPKFEKIPPLVSILMAYYNDNNNDYVLDTLDSVINQNYKHWELIFVDDCSPNGGLEKVSRHYNDIRIKYLKMDANSGAAAARNVAFSKAEGEYIIYFDSDDIMHPNFLGYLVENALGPDKPDVVIQDTICFDGFNQVWHQKIKSERALTIANWIPGQSLSKRSVWEITGGQSVAEEIRLGCQDWEFWLNAFEKNGKLKFGHVNLPIYLYRQHKASISSKRNFHEYRIRKYIYTTHKKIFDRHGTGPKFLAIGYIKSVYANLASGNITYALRLLLLACKVVPIIDLAVEITMVMYRSMKSFMFRFLNAIFFHQNK